MCQKYDPRDYSANEKLYRGYCRADLDEATNSLQVNAITFPDFSCNWSRFSTPEKIRERENGKLTDGCYAFTVEVSRYKDMATTCHDPIISQNYSHTEVRQLTFTETIDFEPPKGRKLTSGNWSRSKRLEYRQNIINLLIVEFEATD